MNEGDSKNLKDIKELLIGNNSLLTDINKKILWIFALLSFVVISIIVGEKPWWK
jgi:hypothetical protein|tara:strand:- start:287 stop:448 length:162 start_codon:yes stop_codon:yes gene_type:complete